MITLNGYLGGKLVTLAIVFSLFKGMIETANEHIRNIESLFERMYFSVMVLLWSDDIQISILRSYTAVYSLYTHQRLKRNK